MAITLNRVMAVGFASPSPTTQTLPFTVTGNLIIISTVVDSGKSITGITDNKSNVYVTSLALTESSTGGAVKIFYCAGATSGVTSVTVTYTGTTAGDLNIYDCSSSTGGAFDTSVNTVGGTATAKTLTLSGVAGAGICVAMITTVTISDSGVTGSFTEDGTAGNITDFDAGAHYVNSAGGTITATFNYTSSPGTTGGVAAAFKEAAITSRSGPGMPVFFMR